MEVVCNGILSRVEIQGYVISCTPLEDNSKTNSSNINSSSNTTEVFSSSEITQLLRSRRDSASAKVVVGSKIIMMHFVNPKDREEFIHKVQNIESTEGENNQWVTSTICHAAVDLGILDEKELESLIKEELSRGVVIAFDAIGSLVDPNTFKLRPITDQLENDILRQVPILAKIFERHVVDEETKQRFWEAVVRKYFCFSRTFLEEEMRDLEKTNDIVLPGTDQVSISTINLVSGRALPKAKTIILNHSSPTNILQKEIEHPYVNIFHGRPLSFRYSRNWSCDVQTPLSHLVVKRPPLISRVLPKESTNREILELLRKFWSVDKNQKKALVSKLKNIKNISSSILQRRCVNRAIDFLEEKGTDKKN